MEGGDEGEGRALRPALNQSFATWLDVWGRS
jgi:hypothetical protein